MENVRFLLEKVALVEEELGCDTSSNNQQLSNNRREGRDAQPDPKAKKLEDEVLALKNIHDFANGNWRLTYYQNKFHIQEDDLEDFLAKISKAYLEGINWVYQYYYRGCPSWEWYYPFHYAPLAVDLVKHSKSEYKFDKGTPYNPVEQLMSVLPKQSSHALPKCLRPLLAKPESEIIDFYPIRFSLDMDGFKFAWMGVNLLPFVGEERLLKAVKDKEELFSEDDKKRNTTGNEQLLFNTEHIPNLGELLERSADKAFEYDMRNEDGHKLVGRLKHMSDTYLLDSQITRPKKGLCLDDILVNKVLNIIIEFPKCDYHT